jgi:hypothetical protein
MTVSITDQTTSVTTAFTIHKGGPFDSSNLADPNSLLSNGTFDTISTATGLELVGITAVSNNPGAPAATTLSIGGTALVVPGVATSGDIFHVTIEASQTFFTNPLPGTATLGDSQSYTLTSTIGRPGDMQVIKSFYDPTNTLYGIGGTHTPGITLALPASPATPPVSSPPNGETIGVSPFVIPYSLTTELDITLTGNRSSPNAKDVFGAATMLVPAVPEPSSLVLLFSLGIPGLCALELLRRKTA